MEISLIKKGIRALRENAQVAYVASVNEEGFPQIKGMLVLEHDSMKTHYCSTNTSSKRVAQFLKNPKASVYYVDDTKDQYKGALFTGTMEVCTDHETKAFLWREGFEMYPGNAIAENVDQPNRLEDGFIEITDPEEAERIVMEIGRLLASNTQKTNEAILHLEKTVDEYKEITKSILR